MPLIGLGRSAKLDLLDCLASNSTMPINSSKYGADKFSLGSLKWYRKWC